jgi:hypothetical protein
LWLSRSAKAEPFHNNYQVAKRAAADIEGHSEAAKFGQPE